SSGEKPTKALINAYISLGYDYVNLKFVTGVTHAMGLLYVAIWICDRVHTASITMLDNMNGI
ncbi:hypothetical protein ACKVMW_22730, partial [Vibrio chagasii]|uniref:hypothetical protein n=1 Tax=Vibrio chagasii TaxID=170679 RepID=UPI003DA171BF